MICRKIQTVIAVASHETIICIDFQENKRDAMTDETNTSLETIQVQMSFLCIHCPNFSDAVMHTPLMELLIGRSFNTTK